MKKVTIRIPEALFCKAKKFAEETGQNFSQVVRKSLEAKISDYRRRETSDQSWSLPPVFDLGETLAPEAAWTAHGHE